MAGVAPDPELARRIKYARQMRGWSQQQLADRVGRSRKAVDNWEHARSTPLNLVKLEDVLGVQLGAEPEEETYTDEAEAAIWALSLPVDQRRRLIAAIRESRRAAS